MEDFKICLEEANKALKTADHLVYVTYPLVNDVKLVITIIENLHKALLRGVDALLLYDYLYKRISGFPSDLKSRLEIFRDYCLRRYNIPRESLILIVDVNNLVEHRKKSPTEFIRSGKFVMCTSDYKMRVLNFEKVKDYNSRVKEFINKLNGIIR